MVRAIVLRSPGSNCDLEMAQACRLAGFQTDLVHINTLLKNPESLLDYHFLAIPGGFSYGDDLGAGTLLAKNLQIGLGPVLKRFVDEGRPVLGLCNGFQVLVKLGILPGDFAGPDLQASLVDNESAQFECRWVTLAVRDSECIFTEGLSDFAVPIAHGEGRFLYQGPVGSLRDNKQVPLVYTSEQGSDEIAYPANPNGSQGNIAGVCNEKGNVLGMMPHPERYVFASQHPQRLGDEEGKGAGLAIFQNAYRYAKRFAPEATSSYAASGVDVKAGEEAIKLMSQAVKSTHGPEVLAGVGAFAGVFDASSLQSMKRPALVASTDGVGTKTIIAAQAGRLERIGHDLVHHSVNDLLAQGAKPLFFMDYIAVEKLYPDQVATVVKSVADACRGVGCALLGGETAEMPGVYHPGAFDLAGTIVGVVERDDIITGENIQAGDILLGLPSDGLHTNGYSLARKVLAPYGWDKIFPELGEPLIEALLRPHRCYSHEILGLRAQLRERGGEIKGIAHITGGGFEGNISRILPAGTQANIQTDAWKVPALFELIARLGEVPKADLYRSFNMGIGMVLVLTAEVAQLARTLLPELITIGSIANGEGVVLQ